MRAARIVLAFAAIALVAAGIAQADDPSLAGSVGPGYTISVRDASGALVNHLDPGTYSLAVSDKSSEHNFHLTGPGVDVSTEVDQIGDQTFKITLTNGTYTFLCDAHNSRMNGQFTVGTAPPTDPPPPKAPSTATKVVLTVTGSAVTLKTPSGKVVKTLPTGPAVVTVRDRSAKRGVRLTGAGAGKATTAAFVGTVTWKVKLVAGTLRYRSDAKAPVLPGGRVTVS
jgi:hypothetical protein